MQFTMVHNNINVAHLDESLAFYEKALNLKEIRRLSNAEFTIVYLGDGVGTHLLELTELKNHPHKYNLGENEFHLAFVTDNFDQALAYHKAMNCVCYENPQMGIYFISDPDGYWLEILPQNEH
ncbi:MAG: VOC family protein [Peptococcaceae bacterium]|nr:VOC family protein [Peptococcaceae bacterium]